MPDTEETIQLRIDRNNLIYCMAKVLNFGVTTAEEVGRALSIKEELEKAGLLEAVIAEAERQNVETSYDKFSKTPMFKKAAQKNLVRAEILPNGMLEVWRTVDGVTHKFRMLPPADIAKDNYGRGNNNNSWDVPLAKYFEQAYYATLTREQYDEMFKSHPLTKWFSTSYDRHLIQARRDGSMDTASWLRHKLGDAIYEEMIQAVCQDKNISYYAKTGLDDTQERIKQIDKQVALLEEQYKNLVNIAPGTPGFKTASQIADELGRLTEEKQWLTKTGLYAEPQLPENKEEAMQELPAACPVSAICESINIRCADMDPNTEELVKFRHGNGHAKNTEIDQNGNERNEFYLDLDLIVGPTFDAKAKVMLEILATDLKSEDAVRFLSEANILDSNGRCTFPNLDVTKSR